VASRWKRFGEGAVVLSARTQQLRMGGAVGEVFGAWGMQHEWTTWGPSAGGSDTGCLPQVAANVQHQPTGIASKQAFASTRSWDAHFMALF
jgi:hypothetical protein